MTYKQIKNNEPFYLKKQLKKLTIEHVEYPVSIN